jgi:hypothetical protein
LHEKWNKYGKKGMTPVKLYSQNPGVYGIHLANGRPDMVESMVILNLVQLLNTKILDRIALWCIVIVENRYGR